MVTTRSRTPFVIAALIVVVAVAGLLAVVLTRGSDDDAAAPSTTTQGSADVTAGDAASVAATGYGDVVVAGAPLPELTDGPNDPAIGMTAPTLTGTTYTGEPIQVTPGQDGPTMLVFLAHWCPACNAEIPVLNEWRDSGAVPADLRVVGVSTAVTNERPNFPPAQWLADQGWTWPTMADDENLSAFTAYGGSGFPFFVVIGADGTVKARNLGELPVEQLDALVDAALA